MKVEELSSYGDSFDHMPLKAQLLQLKVMFSELRRKFGLFGTVGFIMKVYKKTEPVYLFRKGKGIGLPVIKGEGEA